jgi:hypothetical protein
VGVKRANASPCMLRDTRASCQVGLVFTDRLLCTRGLPACTPLCRKALKPSKCYLDLSHLPLDPPNSQEAVNATNEQGVVAGLSINNVDEIAHSLANTTAICIEDWSTYSTVTHQKFVPHYRVGPRREARHVARHLNIITTTTPLFQHAITPPP